MSKLFLRQRDSCLLHLKFPEQREVPGTESFDKKMTYSIVIPAYNEGQRLAPSLEKVLAYVQQQGWDAEVIVVNDGSKDNTADIVREFAAKDPLLRLVENPGNRGKGYAVQNGMLKMRGKIIVFSDAALSAPIEEMP